MLQPLRHRLNEPTNQIVLGIFLACIFVAVVEAAHWTNGWRTHITTTDGVTRVEVAHQRDRLKAKMKGDITWAEDDSGIEGLGPGAFFEIEERSKGQRRRLDFTRGVDGTPRVAWLVNRKAVPFDESARDWLRQTLPKIHRHTGFNAAGRVARFLSQGGVDAVLQEIVMIPSDSVQGIYFQHLMEQASPDDQELVQILDLARQEIRSDFEQAKVVEFLSLDRLTQAEVGATFLRVAETIGSDFELRRSLTNMLEGQHLEPPLAMIFLEAGRSIDSDFEMASFLTALSEAHTKDAPLPATFADALQTVGSDFEQRRVASAVLERHQETSTLDLLLPVAAGIESDYEQAEFLCEVVDVYPLEVPLPPSFFSTLKTVGSDFEHRRVLVAVLDRSDLDQGTLGFVLRSAQNIGSDFELAEILLRLVRHHPLDDEFKPLLEEVLQTIGSDFERQRVLKEFMNSSESVGSMSAIGGHGRFLPGAKT